MVALPSSLLSPDFCLAQIAALHELYAAGDLSTSQHSFSLSPSSPALPELGDLCGEPPSLPGAAGDSLNPREKDSHNAYERTCRKRLNELYSSLRSLLPPHADQSKKLSIPSTIARVLKYIPEQQQRVEQLKRKKEEMLSKVSSSGNPPQFADAGKAGTSPAISALFLNEKEIMIQICVTSGRNGNAGGRDSRVSLSRVLGVLEDEGLQLMNASSFATDDGRIFHSLHLLVNNSEGHSPNPINLYRGFGRVSRRMV